MLEEEEVEDGNEKNEEDSDIEGIHGWQGARFAVALLALQAKLHQLRKRSRLEVELPHIAGKDLRKRQGGSQTHGTRWRKRTREEGMGMHTRACRGLHAGKGGWQA